MTKDTNTRTDATDAGNAADSEPPRGQLKRFLTGFSSALKTLKAHPISFLIATLCLGACLLLMANAEQITRGPLLGLGFLILGVLSLMSTFGLFDTDDDAASLKQSALGQLPGEPAWMSLRFSVPAAALILFGGAFGLGYDYAPTFILLAHAALLPAAIRRPGLMVFTVVSAIYLPLLGTTSLWDPWETHYGEVAREIIERDDWISLWWAQENWFWSKPILIFWTEALSLGFFGVDTSPHAHPMHPEWAIRMPAYLFSIAATLTSYAAIRRVFGLRAGVLSALVLATAPHFFMLAHQAITDMFLVSNIVMAMCMLILAVSEEPDRKVKRYRLGRFTVSGQHALIFGLMMIALPQIFYLITRNISFFTGDQFGFALHADEFLFGSAGNDGVPGNAAHQLQRPAYPGLQPALQGFAWLTGLFFLLRMLLRERRARALYMFAFYGFCALAFMGKGIPGFALPGMIALLFLIGARRWDLLFEGQLRIAPGALMVAVTGLPWYVAMYVRHGAAFTNRLLIHDQSTASPSVFTVIPAVSNTIGNRVRHVPLGRANPSLSLSVALVPTLPSSHTLACRRSTPTKPARHPDVNRPVVLRCVHPLQRHEDQIPSLHFPDGATRRAHGGNIPRSADGQSLDSRHAQPDRRRHKRRRKRRGLRFQLATRLGSSPLHTRAPRLGGWSRRTLG